MNVARFHYARGGINLINWFYWLNKAYLSSEDQVCVTVMYCWVMLHYCHIVTVKSNIRLLLSYCHWYIPVKHLFPSPPVPPRWTWDLSRMCCSLLPYDPWDRVQHWWSIWDGWLAGWRGLNELTPNIIYQMGTVNNETVETLLKFLPACYNFRTIKSEVRSIPHCSPFSIFHSWNYFF